MSICDLQPPQVQCVTRLWHPNIDVTGEVCLRWEKQ